MIQNRKYIFRLLTILILCFGFSMSADAQRKKPPKEKTEKKKSSKKDSNRAQKVKQLGDSRDRHMEIQDRKTRKRMKQTRKKSMINAGKKKPPFYKRWFRRKRK